jgi:hypothetical protein
MSFAMVIIVTLRFRGFLSFPPEVAVFQFFRMLGPATFPAAILAQLNERAGLMGVGLFNPTLRVHRQQVSAFMLMHGNVFPPKKGWTMWNLRWLQEQSFEHPAYQLVR